MPGSDPSAPSSPTLAGNAAAAPSPTQAAGATAESDHDRLNAARLDRGISSAVNQKGGNVTLRLTPPELGTVRIQLSMQGTTVSAQFHAETASARTLLTQQLAQLKGGLEAQGLTVEKIGVQAMPGPGNSSSLSQQNGSSQQQPSQSQAEADGRSRGQQQQSPGQQQSSPNDAEEDRARDNLAEARGLFSDLLGADPAA